MKYQKIKDQWKKHRQRIYRYYKKVRNIRLVAEKYKITYPRAWQIIHKEEYATPEQEG
jgi:hypothetical protein